MKRSEEINQAASAHINIEMIPFRKYFVLGAEWADKNPRKGLVDIDKLAELLLNNNELKD